MLSEESVIWVPPGPQFGGLMVMANACAGVLLVTVMIR
jgi:hypothetical protein